MGDVLDQDVLDPDVLDPDVLDPDVLVPDVLDPWPVHAISNIRNIRNNWPPPARNNSSVRVRNRVGKPKRKSKLTKQQIQQIEATAKKMQGMRGGKRKSKRRKRQKNKRTKRKRTKRKRTKRKRTKRKRY